MEMVLTFFKYSFLKKVQSLDSAAECTDLLALHSWLSELLTHLCLQALYQPASQPVSQQAVQPTSQLC